MAQLRELGLTVDAVELRLRRGRLHRVHRGVYAVGHPRLTFRGQLWAGLLACGGPRRAALSHRSAAVVWDLLPAGASRIDLTTRASSHGTRALRVHRSRTLRPGDVVLQPDGLAVTSVARTLVDLAGVLTPHALERVCHRAQVVRLLDASAVAAQLDRGRRRGARRLRAALQTLAAEEPTITRSALEERFLALVRSAGLPRPRTNARVLGFEVDVLWAHRRLVVELDGVASHLTPRAFERDRERDAVLQVARYAIVRFTWRQVVAEPDFVVATLRALLT